MKIRKCLGINLRKAGVAMAICLVSFTSVYAAPTTEAGNCATSPVLNTDFTRFAFPPNALQLSLGGNVPLSVLNIDRTSTVIRSGYSSGLNGRICYFATTPTTAPDTSCSVATSEVDGGTSYMALLNTTDETYCLYQYNVNTNASPVRFFSGVFSLVPPQTTPVNVPIFTPLGLLGLLSGLLWFGNRRKKLQK